MRLGISQLNFEDWILYTASLIPSPPHPAFGHPLPRGEGLGVRGQPQRSNAHANLLMSPCSVLGGHCSGRRFRFNLGMAVPTLKLKHSVHEIAE